uniref:Uncharacterized protein n=1 Tax=Arundo donax TaxID=35708 RepID=A0A0A9E0C9_ARUDO
MSPSFKRRFSQRSRFRSAIASTTSPLAKVESTVPSPLTKNSLFSSDASDSMCIDDKSCAKEAQLPVEDGKDAISKFGVFEGTPEKFANTPVRLMASTPDLKTPKRSISTSGYDTPPLKMVERSACAKLFTTPKKGSSSMDGETQSASVYC